MRILALVFALAACSAPCPLVCQDDSECPAGYYCLNNAACMQDCVRCASGQCVGSVNNCASCNVACAAGQKCSLSVCGDACGTGLTDCSGSCFNVVTDRLNCGSCGHACQRDEICSGSTCTKVDVCQ